MSRSFSQIMRDAYRARKAGLSVFVALASTMDDDDWEVVWRRMLTVAMLESALKKYRPRGDVR